jgi:hypothetical protein
VLVPVDGEPRVVEVSDGLEGLQALVGGRVENFARMRLSRARTIDLWCHEDFLFEGFPPNRLVEVPGYDPTPIFGPIVATAADEETGESYSLTDEEAALVVRAAASWRKPVTTDLDGESS